MYNGGKGKLVSIVDLIVVRNRERNAMLSAIRRKKRKGKSGPNILDNFKQDGDNREHMRKGTKHI